MPVLRPSGSDFTSFVKAAAQYVPAGRSAKVSKSGGVSVALPGLGAVVRTSQVGALASPTTSAVIINGVTPRPTTVAAVVARVLLGIVTTLAGAAGVGAFADGTGAGARFNYQSGVAVTSTGDIVVADTDNHRIRLVTPAGVVTTLAGSGTPAFADGTGAAASFNKPWGVAVIPSSGVIVVADQNNHRIRLVTPLGVVTTLAGSGTAAFADGAGAAASFNLPVGVAVTPTGDIIVADRGNNRIRLVTSAGVVTTLAGQTTGGFLDGTGAGARFSSPYGVAVIPSSGVIVVADTNNFRIRLVTPLGVVTTLAGSTQGFANGTGAGVSFNEPFGVAVIPSSGDIVVADASNHRIRLVTPLGVVTTLAGSGSNAFADGTGAAASFAYPYGVAVTPTGDVVVADSVNLRIRVIT